MPKLDKYEAAMILGILAVDTVMLYFIYKEYCLMSKGTANV